MTKRKRIIEVFTKYGYLDIDAVEPNHEEFLLDIKKLNLEMKIIGSLRMSYEIRITGCESDIVNLLKKWWDPSENDLKDYKSRIKII